VGISCRAYNELWADQKVYALYWAHEVPQLKFIDLILGDSYRTEGNLKEAMRYYRLANHGKYIDAAASNNIGVMQLNKNNLKRSRKRF